MPHPNVTPALVDRHALYDAKLPSWFCPHDSPNPLLFRLAFKLATGSGKTLVKAMLIAWQLLNKLANRQDARFPETFLTVGPGITGESVRMREAALAFSLPGRSWRTVEFAAP
jgi:type III restriction enzyme